MAMFRKTYEELGMLANVAGSHRCLKLYKSLFNSSDLDAWGAFANLEAGWNGYAKDHELLDLEGDRERYQGDAIGSFISNLERRISSPLPRPLLALCDDALSRYSSVQRVSVA